MVSGYIIGSGISAFIAKKEFPDYKIISAGISKLPELFYFWDTKETRKFCKKHKISYKTKVVKIKKIGEDYKRYNKITHKPIKNMPCENKKSFKALEISIMLPEPDFIDIIGKVEKKFLVGKTTIHHIKNKNIIWTAPVDRTLFFGKKIKAEYFPITYINFDGAKLNSGIDILYLLNKECLDINLYRASQNKKGVCFEYSGFLSIWDMNAVFNKIKEILGKNYKPTKISKILYGNKLTDLIYTNPRGFVVMPKKNTKIKNVFFVGRYAQGNPEIKANEVIDRILKISKGVKK